MDVPDSEMKTLEISEDLGIPSSVESIASNFLLLSNHDRNFSVSHCSRPSVVPDAGSANSKSNLLKPTSPSTSKCQPRKFHQLYAHRHRGGFVFTDLQQTGFMTSSPICERRIANRINDKSAKDFDTSEGFISTDFNNDARRF